MQHVSNFAHASTTQRPLASPEPTRTSLSDQHLARLWERMAKIYGHRWTTAYGERDDGTWKQGLVNITAAMIRHGLSRCVKRVEGWPPTLPEFRALCTLSAEDLGLPNPGAAYHEAAMADRGHSWSHPAVHVAAQAVGLFKLRTLPEAKSWPLFERAYEIVVRRVLAGEQFAAPVPQALEKLPTPARPETVQSALASMRAALGSRKESA